MKLEIIGVGNTDGLENECVNLKALEDCNLGDYLVADCTFIDEHDISNTFRHTFFFPSWKVKKGEEVLLWTSGEFEPQKNEFNGLTVHQFSWGSNEQIWNDDGDCAFLFEIKEWQSFKVASKK